MNEYLKVYKNRKVHIKKNMSFKEVNFLRLNSQKVKSEIKWKAKLNFKETIKITIDWYKGFHEKKDLEKLTKEQIKFSLNK